MTHRVMRAALAVVLLGVGTACAPPRNTDVPGARSSDVIYLDELTASKTQNAYDAVRRLRPRFMQPRGQTSLLLRTDQVPAIYLDNRRYGDLESLRMLPIDGIFEIRFLSANQAQQRWGMNHAAGVIHVLSMTGRTVPQS
jgi:hypothetical protein